MFETVLCCALSETRNTGGKMEITQKAIVKAILLYGTSVLNKKDIFCTLLDDMIPEQDENLQFIKIIYTDEIGHILSEVSQASYNDKERYYHEIDDYLQSQCGLAEPMRKTFIDLFRGSFRKKTVEVKKYKDYKPALRMLKQKFGTNLPEDIVQAFVEENRLFCRFSLTGDDVRNDIKTV